VQAVPVGELRRRLEAAGDVLEPSEVAALREALRIALAA
jgi:hypothetical protein